MNIKNYFNIKELVCKHVYNKFGEMAWTFFDPRLLETICVIREKLGKPITVNTWHSGGSLTQRGLRCNVCQLVAEKTRLEKVYVSAHLQGSNRIENDLSELKKKYEEKVISIRQAYICKVPSEECPVLLKQAKFDMAHECEECRGCEKNEKKED